MCRKSCPIGMAPTTSTTMMMSLGDALAVALMERKGFSADRIAISIPAAAWAAPWCGSAT